jgi:hypothetical protein
MLKTLCSDAKAKSLGATFAYQFQDETAALLGSIELSGNDCAE